MAWRFKASKYKNSTPIVPKFENIIRDLSIGSYHSHGNFIEASAAFMAFNWEVAGSNLAVLPLDTKGRQNKAHVPLIYAHGDFITDFKFSPFDDGLLATGSNDTTVKLWRIPPSGMPLAGISQPELVLPGQPRRIETVDFHTTADNILTTSSGNALTVWDLVAAQDLFTFADHSDEVQSVSWEITGKLMATQCKDKMLRILDPRSQNFLVGECGSHEGIKDSKVVWIGDSQRLLTTGFSGDRTREIIIRDLRNLKSPQKVLTLDMSSGILIPLFDPDTNMCFLAGKGDRNVQFVEVTNAEPFIIEGLKYSGEQTKGACLVPKRAMDVMQAEVNRVLQLCDSSIVPITWQVPRKTYREYHVDVYPETSGLESNMGPSDWWTGANVPVPKIELDPKKRPKEVLTVFQEKPLSERPAAKKPTLPAAASSAKNGVHSNGGSHANGVANGKQALPNSDNIFEENIRKNQEPAATSRPTSLASTINTKEPQVVKAEVQASKPEMQVSKPEVQVGKDGDSTDFSRQQAPVRDPVNDDVNFGQLRKKNIFLTKDAKDNSAESNDLAPPAQTKRPTSKVFGRISKFKHLKGDVILKGRFENLKNLSKTMPAECNFVHANINRIALPLTGPGGKIAIFETARPGRIPDGVTPVLINGANVMDFAFDPFNNQRLVAACDDGQVRVWQIPEKGLTHPINEPEVLFSAHPEKVQLVKFHPTAKDVLLTAAFDKSVKIWNLNDVTKEKMTLVGHRDQLFSAEWSKCGRYLATVSRDGKVRIFEPKVLGENSPLIEGGEIVPKKGARVAWVLDNKYLVITGFTKTSERQLSLFRVKDLNEMTSLILDVSPTILRPFYDEGSSTLFITGKGDSLVSTFEVSEDSPHFFPLSPYRPSGLHQGLAFLPKCVCDVRAVEFARAFRILDNSIEPVSFTVPRIKNNFFQDDLFPPAQVTWLPTMTAEEWFAGNRKEPAFISLQPDDMQALGEAVSGPTSTNSTRTSAAVDKRSSGPVPPMSAKEQASDLQDSVSRILHVSDKLEQDQMEGAEPEDWDE